MDPPRRRAAIEELKRRGCDDYRGKSALWGLLQVGEDPDGILYQLL